MSCENKTPIVLCKVEDYDPETLDRAVASIFSQLQLQEAIRPGMRVVLKPNLLMRKTPDKHTTTHPQVVRAVAAAVTALGAQVRIIDSPGGPFLPALLREIYRVSGIEAAAAQSGATLSFDTSFGERSCGEAKLCHSFSVLTELLNADYIINLPKLKTHGMTTFSCSVKNMFGAIPGLQKPEMHWRYKDVTNFCEMLIDLTLTVPPNVSIVDGIVGMEGDGPSSGVPRACGVLAAGVCSFTLDSVLAGYIGLENAPTVTLSAARGLVREPTLLGDTLPPIRPFLPPKSASVDFVKRLPKPLQAIGNALSKAVIDPKPVVDTTACIGCKKCGESCPAGVISFPKKAAVIDYERCIRCFCCHELCPVSAIKIRRFKGFRF